MDIKQWTNDNAAVIDILKKHELQNALNQPFIYLIHYQSLPELIEDLRNQFAKEFVKEMNE